MNKRTYSPGFHKLIHHLEHLKKLEKREPTSPLHVSVFPTNACQLKCKYCCFMETERTTEELSYEDFVLAVDVLSKNGLKALELSGGGDPLLWSHFEKGVSYAYEKGLKLSLVTNGLDINKYTKDTLEKFSWIRISIQSSNYIDKLKIGNIPDTVKLSFSFIASDTDDIEEIKNIYERVYKKGIIVRVSPIRPSTTEWENIVIEEVERLGEPLISFKKEKGTPAGCYMLWIRAAIDWKGNFLPCPSIELSPEYFGKIPDSFAVCKIPDLEKWLYENPVHDLGYRCSFCNCGKDTNDFIHELLKKVEDVDFV